MMDKIGVGRTEFNQIQLKYSAKNNKPICRQVSVGHVELAQAMDVLSSQSNIAGYKAVLDSAHEFGRALPMMMTAAGTVPPAKVVRLLGWCQSGQTSKVYYSHTLSGKIQTKKY